MALFGDSVRTWYLARILGFALTMAAAWILLARAAGFAMGSAFALFLSSQGYWAGVWCCLGVTETYTVPGTVALLFGCWLVWKEQNEDRSRAWRIWGWALIAAGGVAATGSKENMPFLILPAIWVAWRDWRRRRLAWWVALSAGLFSAFAPFVSGALAVAITRHGSDEYAQSAAGGSRLRVILDGLARANEINVMLALAVIVCAWFLWRGRGSQWRGVAVLWLALEALLYVLYAGQLFFNNGAWEKTARYAFPGEIIAALAWFMPAILIWQSRRLLSPATLRWQRLAVAGVCAALLLVVVVRGYYVSRAAALRTRDTTRAFSGGLRRLAYTGIRHPQSLLVVHANRLQDLEAMLAVPVFMRFFGAPNPVALRINENAFQMEAYNPALRPKLWEMIQGARQGKEGFAPATLLDSTQECFEISLAGNSVPGSRCTLVAGMAP